MNDTAFQELLKSVHEAGRIRRGQQRPARKRDFPTPDVRRIRTQLQLSQSQFATLVGISIDTLQNWEQHRRHPRGPALALLKILEKDPERAIETLNRQ